MPGGLGDGHLEVWSRPAVWIMDVRWSAYVVLQGTIRGLSRSLVYVQILRYRNWYICRHWRRTGKFKRWSSQASQNKNRITSSCLKLQNVKDVSSLFKLTPFYISRLFLDSYLSLGICSLICRGKKCSKILMLEFQECTIFAKAVFRRIPLPATRKSALPIGSQC